MIRLALPLIALATIGCTPATGEQDVIGIPPPPTACHSERVFEFIGKTRTDAISADVARLSGAKSIRWISPGMAVTMDYREDRLNVKLDEKGVILSFTCG